MSCTGKVVHSNIKVYRIVLRPQQTHKGKRKKEKKKKKSKIQRDRELINGDTCKEDSSSVK